MRIAFQFPIWRSLSRASINCGVPCLLCIDEVISKPKTYHATNSGDLIACSFRFFLIDMEEGCDLDPHGLTRSVKTEDMIVQISREESRDIYSKLRNEREKSTFSMMMKMNPEALTAVRKEFFMREDRVKLPEFIYIIQRHLSGGAQTLEKDFHSMDTDDKREFGLNMCELFKEIDVNGDGDLEWQVSDIILTR